MADRSKTVMLPLLLAALALMGCNQSGRPRGGEAGLGGPVAAAPARQVATAGALTGGRDYMVVTGDTVYGVAGRFGVPVRTLIDANQLTAPFRLRPGQRLIVPAPREHVVQAGDTTQGIARRYGIDQSTLIRLNDIPPPYALRPGARLQLPARVETASAAAPAPAAAPTGTIAVEELPPPSPAQAGGTTPIPTAPQTPPTPITPQAETGPAAPLPAQTAPVPLPIPPAGTGAPETTAPAASPTQPLDPGSETPPPAIAAAEPTPATPAAIPQPPPLSNGKFLWPVNGRIISEFGPKDGGLHNDGINIAAPRGTPVRAAEGGVVAYAGNELRGFGKLLLIRHADGWMSAYAHNDALLVQRGDQVVRGQTIARVGSTGNVSTPQLHFELRRGTESIDPVLHLGTQGAALSPAAFPDDPPGLG